VNLGQPFVIRIRNHALRIALMILLEPVWALQMIIEWSLPVRWGGHPNGWRIFAPDAWGFHFDVWLAGALGYFVDEPRG
jgi:hypothetical protein